VLAIRQRLEAGAYAPGHHLVEAELTQEFGVSRGPLREAMRRLAAEGLLTQEHNRGIRVRRMGPDEIRSLYEVREMLEGLAARLAAGHIRQSDYLNQLRGLSTDMAAAIRQLDIDGYYGLNERLHSLIVQMSHNSFVQNMVAQLRIPAMRMQFRQPNQLERSRKSHEDHKPLIKALLKGDADAAERAMRQHIRNSAKFVSSLGETGFTPSATRKSPRPGRRTADGRGELNIVDSS
jgi:DNA-binding GntR family transcriptional regulator